jgi:hypothetical protein
LRDDRENEISGCADFKRVELTYMIANKSKIRDYNCKKCKATLLQYGNFKAEFPDTKEIRMVKGNIWRPELNKTAPIPHPQDKSKIMCVFVWCTCDKCGHKNLFNVVLMAIPANVRFKF